MPVRSVKIKSAKDWEKEYLRRRGMQQRTGGVSGRPHGYNPYRDAQGRFATGPHKAKEQGLKGPRRTAAAVGAFTRARRLAEAKAGMRRHAAPAVKAMTKVRRRLASTAAARIASARVARAKKPTAIVSKPARVAAKPAAVAPAAAARTRRPRRTAAEMHAARKQETAARSERQRTREKAQRERERVRSEREAKRAAARLERDRARVAREQVAAKRRSRTEAARTRSAAARHGSARRAIAVANKPGVAGTPAARPAARPAERPAAKPAQAVAPSGNLGGRTVSEWNRAAIEGRWHPINPTVARSALSQLQGGGKINSMFAHRIGEYAVQLGVGKHQAEHHVHQMVLSGAATLSLNGNTFRVIKPGKIPQQRFISARGIESHKYSSSGAGHFARGTPQRRTSKPSGTSEARPTEARRQVAEKPARRSSEYPKSKTNESYPEVFGRSTATIRVSQASEVENMDDVLHVARKIFGDKFEKHHFASLMGAPDGSNVIINNVDDGRRRGGRLEILLRCRGNGYESIRTFTRDSHGNPIIHNDLQVVDDTGQGMGARAFGRQVEQATRLGVARLETHAAGNYGSTTFNGYYTWPRFGYDADIPSHTRTVLRNSGPVELRNATRVSELMQSPEGREFWRTEGSDLYHAEFDLKPGSMSHRYWEIYQAQRRKQGREI